MFQGLPSCVKKKKGLALVIVCGGLLIVSLFAFILLGRNQLDLRRKCPQDAQIYLEAGKRSAEAHADFFLREIFAGDGQIVWNDENGRLWLAWPKNGVWHLALGQSGKYGMPECLLKSDRSQIGIRLNANQKLQEPEFLKDQKTDSEWQGDWVLLPSLADDHCQIRVRWQLEDCDGSPNLTQVLERPKNFSLQVPGLPNNLEGSVMQCIDWEKGLGDGQCLKFLRQCRASLLRDEYGLSLLPERNCELLRKWEKGLFREPWREVLVIPHDMAISPKMRGKKALDLNDLANEKDTHQAVEKFAAHINQCLPQFGLRGGGLEARSYCLTLGAITLDLIDADSHPRIQANLYRGLEPMPVVSEWYWRYRWLGVERGASKTWVKFGVEIYAELYNPWNQKISGSWCGNFSTPLCFGVGNAPLRRLDSDLMLAYADVKLPKTKENRRWFSEKILEFRPGEWKLVQVGVLNYTVPVGDEKSYVSSPIELTLPPIHQEGADGYAAKWNGVECDKAGGGCAQSGAVLHWPSTKSRPGTKVRAVEAGHCYGTFGKFANNVGDPLISWWLKGQQSANKWPENASPWRRNIRSEILAQKGAEQLSYARTLMSEWPDGGGESSAQKLIKFGQYEGTDPMASQFRPVFLQSQDFAWFGEWNLGVMQSVTQLGGVYDPVLWNNPKGGDQIFESAQASNLFGGGNTLRIGRVEHEKFNHENFHAAWLMDIFSAQIQETPEEGKISSQTRQIDGEINLNTASADILSLLLSDCHLGLRKPQRILNIWDFSNNYYARFDVPEEALRFRSAEAVSAIVKNRPISSWCQLARLVDSEGKSVWQNSREDWDACDAWKESPFACLKNRTTMVSRNFLWKGEVEVSRGGRVVARKVFYRNVSVSETGNPATVKWKY